MTTEQIEEFVRTQDDPELSKRHGMVTQIWQDGELTHQKSGELLWQRSLHCIEPEIGGARALAMEFPHKHGPNSFAWVSTDVAYEVRDMIRQVLGLDEADRMRDFYKMFKS